MSGHSKWATTHRQKEIKDAKRGAAFTKLAANITLAVRLQRGVEFAIFKAREANMPKENIQRAVDKGSGKLGGELLEEVRYEGFLPGGAGILVDVLTDNKLRTQQQVRTILDKSGGTMSGAGSVSYLFSQVGEIVASEDELTAIDCGAIDVETHEGKMRVITNHDELFKVKEALEGRGVKVFSAELIMKPLTTVVGEAETIIENIEAIDEVINVWTNYA
jgi:Uncharacterized conserved protein